MVSGELLGLTSLVVALAADGNRTVLSRLPPTQRARILMALLALVVVGVALVALIAMGARWYRRTNQSTTSNDMSKRQDMWSSKPLKTNSHDADADDDSKGDHSE